MEKEKTNPRQFAVIYNGRVERLVKEKPHGTKIICESSKKLLTTSPFNGSLVCFPGASTTILYYTSRKMESSITEVTV